MFFQTSKLNFEILLFKVNPFLKIIFFIKGGEDDLINGDVYV
jgi:hypothetical protein